MKRGPDTFRPGRVRASWAILGAAALVKAAFVGWLGWLSLSLVAVSRALAEMAHVPPPAALSASGWLFGVALWNNLDGVPSVAGALAELIVGSTAEIWAVAAVQRRLLARARLRAPDGRP